MDNQIDEAFLSIPEFVKTLSDLGGGIEGIREDEMIRLEIEEVKMELPIQLDIIVDDDGKVLLGSVPPLYDVPTSFDPVFHKMGITLERNEL